MTRAARSPGRPPADDPSPWHMRLYVAGQSAKSMAAFNNLKRFCERYLPGQYHIEVVDLLKDPRLAAKDDILAIPTLVRKVPVPIRKIIGDLSNRERVLVGLDIQMDELGELGSNPGGTGHNGGRSCPDEPAPM